METLLSDIFHFQMEFLVNSKDGLKKEVNKLGTGRQALDFRKQVYRLMTVGEHIEKISETKK